MGRYASSAYERNYGCRLREFIFRGIRCVTLENEKIRVLVAAEKGADILEFLWKPSDVDVLWHSPTGLRPPGAAKSAPRPEGEFRDLFAGGWYEMLPNGPEPCTHAGTSWGNHGESTLLPWNYTILQDDPHKIGVRFETRLTRIPLHVEKTMWLHQQSGTLTIEEKVTNFSDQTVEALWGQHPTFGWPFLEENCRVYLPPCKAQIEDKTCIDARLAAGQKGEWPWLRNADGEKVDLSVLPAPEMRSHDFVRLTGLEQGWFAIVNPRLQVGWALKWDVQKFPVLGFWQLYRGGSGYPWYGMHYLAALEPANDLPSLSHAVARGTATVLSAGASTSTTWEATAFSQPLEVHEVRGNGEIL
jgi:hypothetical protein